MARPSERYPGFDWQRASRDWELFRIGATEACIHCGIFEPDWLTWVHIHSEDLHLSPDGDERRVFRGCWNLHFGCYGRYRVPGEYLLELERIWNEEPEHRPQPHPRDIELMQRVSLGCEWAPKRVVVPGPLLARMGVIETTSMPTGDRPRRVAPTPLEALMGVREGRRWITRRRSSTRSSPT
jgi:hypothetical protein